jgi:hypothetical protein
VPEPGNQQALNRYAYVNNNPLKYTDPSDHFAWFVAVPIGALIGAGVTYGFQVAANISQNGLNVQAFTEVNWTAVGGGAVAGAVGVATFGLGTAVMGTGLSAMVAAGAISGAVSGQAARATENVLSGQEVTAGLGNPVHIAADAVVAGALAGIGRTVDVALIKARSPGFYSRYVSDGELQAIQGTGLLRGGRPGKTYFTTDQFTESQKAVSRLALPQPPQYRVDFEIVNYRDIQGPQRVQPWIWPLNPGFRQGWGVEYWTRDPVQIRLLNITQLK